MAADTLHEAIHIVLRDGSMLPRDIADRINERRLWIRPSDGRPVEAKQISARVRTRSYRDQFMIAADGSVRSASPPVRCPDPQEPQTRLRAAIGQAVLSAAALEHTLRVVILHTRGARAGVDDGLARDLRRLSTKPGGTLLQQLQALGFDPQITERIGDVLQRRNRLVHHPVEDEVLIAGFLERDVDAAVAHIERIAADCDAIVAETLDGAIRGAMDVAGFTEEQLEDWFRHRDLDAIEDARLRSAVAVLRRAFAAP